VLKVWVRGGARSRGSGVLSLWRTQPVLGEPLGFGGECVGSGEIGAEDGAVHRGEIGGPASVGGRFNMGGPSDVPVAGGEEWSEGVAVNELHRAGWRDSNAEWCHGWSVLPRRIPV